MSIGRVFAWLAERDPDRVAVRDEDRAITRRELDLASNRLAREYRRRGVGVDSVVTVGLPNGVEFYVACAAIWKAGGVPQPVSPRLPRPERQAVVELADPVLLLGVDPAEHPGRACLPAGFTPDPALPDTPLPDVHAASWKAPTSGGSTGRPKLVFSGTPALCDPERPTAAYVPRDAVQLVPGPLHHSAPFLFSMRGLFLGHTLVVQRRFDPVAVLAAVAQHRVTFVLLVPTMMQRIWRLGAEVRAAHDVSSLELVLHLGARCPEGLKRAWLGWLGPERVWEVYSGTESAGVCAIRGDDWLAHPGSVGRPGPGTEFAAVDPAGTVLGPGEVGELVMRRPGAPPAYHYRGAARPRDDGWETLGDLGWVDEQGYVTVADRAADVVVTGGATVWPAEVEAVLDAHPAVRSSAVVGLPDDDLGERVHAVVDAAGVAVDPDALRAWAAARLDPEKVPRTVEVVTQPLRDDAGKVRRSALRTDRLPPG
ncbi:AMP-binding protein [Rhodococcus aerolatus]